MKSLEEIKRELGSVETMCWHCTYEGEPNGCNRPRGTCEMWGTAQDAIEVIEQLEGQIADTGKMGSRWISVRERLPEPDQEVLLIAHGWKGQLLYIGRLHHEEAETSWLTGITTMESEWSINGWSYLKTPLVTHWMPLPELPKEE